MASSQGGDGIFKKIAQLFKIAKRPPPPQFGDGKYDSEEDGPEGTTLKAGIIKELNIHKMKNSTGLRSNFGSSQGC